MIVTVDGPGGSGKSTVARIVAHRLGLPYLNSGYIYRAVTLRVLEEGGDFDNIPHVEALIRDLDLRFQEDAECTRVFVGDREVTSRLKDPDVTPQIYKVANNGRYRELLIHQQRRCAAAAGIVAEGRDMGTVIFPEADFKFFLDASPEVRAQRQHRDLAAAGHTRELADVIREVKTRDRHDRERDVAPLKPAPDAVVIQTDVLTIDDVVEALLRRVGSGAPLREASRPMEGRP